LATAQEGGPTTEHDTVAAIPGAVGNAVGLGATAFTPAPEINMIQGSVKAVAKGGKGGKGGAGGSASSSSASSASAAAAAAAGN